MSWHDPITTLGQMRAFANEARALVAGRDQKAVQADRVLNLALTRLMELIGEAATRLEEGVRDRHPQIPWLQIISLRHRLIHGYDVINFDILWKIFEDDLPPLIRELDLIIARGVT